MALITKDTLITDLINDYGQAADILRQSGMNCVGCISAAGETLEEAALEHNVDPILLVRKLNIMLNGQIG